MTMPTSPTAAAPSLMRIGTVQSNPAPQADFVWVLVDGTVLQCSYFTNYIPVAGDRVIVTQSGTDWFVVGGRSGYTANLVVNPGFTAHSAFVGASSPVPYNWTVVSVSGTAPTSIVQGLSGGPGFGWAIGPSATTASDYYVNTAAFPVTPGQSLDVETSIQFVGSSGGTSTVTQRIGWFRDGQSAYSMFASESVLDTKTNSTGSYVPYVSLLTATVPAGVSYGRLALRLAYSGSSATVSLIVYNVQIQAIH